MSPVRRSRVPFPLRSTSGLGSRRHSKDQNLERGSERAAFPRRSCRGRGGRSFITTRVPPNGVFKANLRHRRLRIPAQILSIKPFFPPGRRGGEETDESEHLYDIAELI